MRVQRAVLYAGFLAVVSVCMGQRANLKALQPLAFLSGRWVSENGTEVQEESWSPVSGNSMTGSFRVVQGGKAVFYEFWAVELDEGQPILKMKHFNADLAGWEEKNASTKMPLASTAENDVVFAAADGSVSLHYHRSGDTLTCKVHHERSGKSSDESFVLTKAGEK